MIKSTKASSAKYGPCEVCCNFASEVFIRRIDCGLHHVFGHHECLKKPERLLLEMKAAFTAKHHGV